MKKSASLLVTMGLGLGLAACNQADEPKQAAQVPETDVSNKVEQVTGQSDEKSNESTMANPFYQDSTLYMQFPAFDKIQNAHYAPAFEKGMADQLAEIAAIANNPEPATFENTLVAMEKSGQTLSPVSYTHLTLPTILLV